MKKPAHIKTRSGSGNDESCLQARTGSRPANQEKYSAIGKSIDEKSSMKKSNKKASGYSAIIAIIIKTA